MRAPTNPYGDSGDPQRRARWASQRVGGLTSGADAYGGHAPPRASLSAAGVYPIQSAQTAYSDVMPDLQGLGSATVMPARPYMPYTAPGAAPALDPDVWLIALPNGAGGMRSLEGAGRPGAIRVSRPYGHLRSIRPIVPLSILATPDMPLDPSGPLGARVVTDGIGPASDDRPASKRGRGTTATKTARPRKTASSAVPAQRPAPQIISAVEVESDAGVFRVERPDSVLDNSDMAWALAHMEQGEPDSVVALPRRQLALLLTLLPPAEDEEQPERDTHWGWAHRLRGPWERGPLHPKGRLGRLIAIDPDLTGHGLHRACFEIIGTDDVVWALGVPCFRQGSVYELTPLGKTSLSRWLTWPMAKIRRRAGGFERPEWEIARVVYRVGQPRWPLAGVVEPLGPMGISG
ncbi:MAG TPA: hypothetical protein VF808_04090 [Ktedonobacterales bacterium]